MLNPVKVASPANSTTSLTTSPNGGGSTTNRPTTYSAYTANPCRTAIATMFTQLNRRRVAFAMATLPRDRQQSTARLRTPLPSLHVHHGVPGRHGARAEGPLVIRSWVKPAVSRRPARGRQPTTAALLPSDHRTRPTRTSSQAGHRPLIDRERGQPERGGVSAAVVNRAARRWIRCPGRRWRRTGTAATVRKNHRLPASIKTR